MGLHVLLHIGLLGKGSATHDALEGLLACVTEGRRHRISSQQREEAVPGQGPWWGGCCRTALGTLCLADQHLDQTNKGFQTQPTRVRARSEAWEKKAWHTYTTRTVWG